MKLSGLVFHPKASSCPRNQWQPRNGLTFLSRSCLRQISQNDPCTFQNLANYLNCCFCIEQSLIIKDRDITAVSKKFCRDRKISNLHIVLLDYCHCDGHNCSIKIIIYCIQRLALQLALFNERRVLSIHMNLYQQLVVMESKRYL